MRTLFAAPLLAAALLVAVAGPAAAAAGGETPMVVSAEVPGALGAVSTAQSDIEVDPESESDTEPRLVGRESSERVDSVVIALWSIAAGMTVMLVLFLWHTSPRRRLRLARRRSMQLYDGEADLTEAAAGARSADDAEYAEDAASAEAAVREDTEAADDSPTDAPPAAGTDGTEGKPRIWMQLRRMLGLD